MNALAIDCAVSRLVIAAKKDDKSCTGIFDIGMRQSEILVPQIDKILETAGLKPSELDYTVLTIGPGSFTGLRLGISAVKAIELAFGVPVYGISSLKTYEYPYKNLKLPVLTCIDANKDKFYASVTGFSDNGKVILEEGDWSTDEIFEKVSELEKLFIAGPDCEKLKSILISKNLKAELITLCPSIDTTQALFELAENEKTAGNPALKDFDGPVYMRASEAEIKLKEATS